IWPQRPDWIRRRTGNERDGSASHYRIEERKQIIYRYLSWLAVPFLAATSREGFGASQLVRRLYLDHQADGNFPRRTRADLHIAARNPLQLESHSEREGAENLRGFGGPPLKPDMGWKTGDSAICLLAGRVVDDLERGKGKKFHA